MGVKLLNWNERVESITKICKSDSGICGKRLREAHIEAGELLANKILESVDAKSFAVIIVMRAGLPFGLGIANGLEDNKKEVSVFFSSKEEIVPTDFEVEEFDKIIISDGVIRTGKSMFELEEKLKASNKIIFAANVVDKTSLASFVEKDLFAVRVSSNSFVGAKQNFVEKGKGPDTGGRLFNSNF